MNLEQPTFIVPLEISFTLRGENITITAADVGHLAQMLQVLTPVLHQLMDLPPDSLERLVSDAGPTQADVVELLQLLSKDPQLPMRMVSIGAPMPLEKVTLLRADEFAYLFAVVVQVNADFFGRALPVLRAAAAKFGALGAAPADPSTPGLASLTS